MATPKPQSRSELLRAYDSDPWLDALTNHLSLVSILESCIIRRNYRIPDDLNNAIHLTESGKRLHKELVAHENVPAKEARLLVYLQSLHVDPLVDFEASDAATIREAISAQIIKRELLFPYTYGRTLYDKAAELFHDERERLNHEETLELLEHQDPGVFQVGKYLLGPYGVTETEFKRGLRPRTRIPLQHCSDTACLNVHSVQLSTSHEAEVNRYRPVLIRTLDQISTEPSDWNGYFEARKGDRSREYADRSEPGVPMLIGDALDDAELHAFFAYVLDNSGGSLRNVCAEQGLPSASASAVSAGMSRQQMHQLLLTQSDADLVKWLDHAVATNVIGVPVGEVRTLRVNSGRTFSAWHLRPQLSRFGYRAVGNDVEMPVLRLGALVRKLYDLSVESEVDELEWQLRQVSGMPLHLRLEHILRTLPPEQVVGRLVFARRANLVKACGELGIDPQTDESEVVDRIMWKLGFRLAESEDVLQTYWIAHRDLERLARSSTGPVDASTSELRGKAADYGVALEDYLEQSLMYSWWSLLHDHYGSGKSFTYRRDAARSFALNQIREAADRFGMPEYSAPGKLTLGPLMSAFGLLSRLLEAMRNDVGGFLRPEPETPRFIESTEMQSFPFGSTVPFLDLDESAQNDIIGLLQEATSKLQGSDIAAVRNSFLHAGREPSAPQAIVGALVSVQAVLTSMEGAGLVPKPFRFVKSEGDRWGRKTFTLSTDDGDSQVIHSPSQYDWVGLAAKRSDQSIFRLATIGHGAECLRFNWGADSNYEVYWRGYPNRRLRPQGYVEQNSDSHVGDVLSGSA